MTDGLSCRCTIIDADVVSRRLELCVQLSSGLIQESKQRNTLVAGQSKEAANVTAGND